MVLTLFKKFLIILFILLVILIVLAVLTHKSLPDNSERTVSTVLPIDPESPLAQHILPAMDAHPGLSGLYLLDDSHEALLARLALAKSAKHSLDVQYYTWHDDTTGHLLMQTLYEAAERGVRVRLLLDDNNTAGMDGLLASVNAHPNIEVRLFNPFMQRRIRALGYLSDFFRLNRRMHNKSFSADGLLTIIGGRNVGDEYFGYGRGVMFADLDLLAIGPAARQVELDFDRYWASESAYPVDNILLSDAEHQDASAQYTFDTTPNSDPDTQQFIQELANASFVSQLQQGTLPLIWTKTTLISDDPAKGLKKSTASNWVLAQIMPTMMQTDETLMVISPYFVPTNYGENLFIELAERGKRVTVLTNSLAATDVIPVHAGYAKYRKPLLAAGVTFYELKPMATVITKDHGGMIKSSGASLHAKTFIVDNQTLFVGSFNMDPRSAALNTEMGFMFDSEEMATYLTENMHKNQMQYSYAVSQTSDGKLHWQTLANDEISEFDNEPHSTFFSRFAVWVCGLLPIEWLL